MKRYAITIFALVLVILTGSLDAQPKQDPPELVLQTGHSKLVEAVVFGKDDRWLASASFDSTIRIWEVESGRELRALSGHNGAVKTLACSPDGLRLASGGNDGTIRIWDVQSGAETSRRSPVKGPIEAIAFSPDGNRLAVGGAAGLVTILEISTGQDQPLPTVATGVISVVAFSPDGKWLAFGGSEGSVVLWDLTRSRTAATLKAYSGTVRSLQFNNASDTLATGGDDRSSKLWRVPTGRKLADHDEAAAGILAHHFTNADQVLAVDASRSIRSWPVNTAKRAKEAGTLTGSGPGEGKSAAFSRNGSFAAIGNGDGTLTLIDTETGKILRTLENHTTGYYGATFSGDRRWLASAGFDNSVKLWDLSTGESLRPLSGHTGRVRNVVFHPDNVRLISAGADRTIRIWEALTGRTLETLEGHTGSISTLAVSPDGRFIVSGGMDQTIGVWDLEKKAPPRFLKGHTGEVISVAVGANSDMIVSAGADGTIRSWDMISGSLKRTIDAAAGEIGAVAISPDGLTLASAGVDKKVSIWDAVTGRLTRSMTGHSAKINSVAFSPDGASVISASQDRTVRIWQVADGAAVRELTGHAGAVYSAAISTDGLWLTSASDDGSIIIWRKETGSRLATLISLKDSWDWLVVSPEGFFDGSPASWEQLSWRFETDTFNVKPVEVFFNEFFLPGLLADLLNERAVPTNSDISSRDRRQPLVRLTATGPEPATPREVKVKVEILDAPAGARDVRLFRNGALVRVWRGDVLAGARTVSLETSIPLVAGENKLAAYAFNADDVKSRNSTLSITGLPTLARRGVSYIVAVGINEYANPQYNLNVADRDAREFAAELKRQQNRVGIAERVETIVLENADATKANILQTLAGLAKKIEPEDRITVFFAGHGIAVDKRFYLVPHDLGYAGGRAARLATDLQTILDHSISDEELNRVAEGIDARQILLVIDACNSGQVLETDEKRRGPMNSKGLAHLAYEKGMYILTASQSFQDAKEDARLGHGYLTYALVEEGLKTPSADRAPKDGQILLREWLDFATFRVPEIDKEEVTSGRKRARQIEREKNKGAGRTVDPGLQRPRVFYRRESEIEPFVIARP